jgi:Protein of unknown function (DUF3887)
MKTSTIALSILLGACCTRPQPAPTTAPPPPPAPPAASEAAPAVPPNPTRGRGIIIPAAPPTFRTKTVLHELINGRPENVINDFNPQMKEALPAEKLGEVWSQIVAKLGTYQSMGEPTQTTEQGYTVVYVPLTFEHGTLRAKVAYDNTNYIAGLYFVP